MFVPQVKGLVSCRQLLEHHNVHVNRQGFANCPLHGDHNASLKVYGGDRGWVCYGCHKGGDVINLAKELYGIGFSEAIRRLNDEFDLGLDLDVPPSARDRFLFISRQQREAEERRQEELREQSEEDEYFFWLDRFLMVDGFVAENEPSRDGEWSDSFCGWLQYRSEILDRLKNLEGRRIRINGRRLCSS